MFNENFAKKYSHLLLLVSTLIWGSAIVITKDLLHGIPSFWILAIRSTGAAILLTLLFWRRWRKLDWGYIRNGGLLGLFLFLGFSFQTVGLKLTTPGKNAFLSAVYCILVPLIYWMVDHKRPDRYNVIASLLCIIGIGFISLKGDFTVNNGDILTLFGSIFWALNIVTVAKCVPGRDVFLLTTLQFTTFALLAWVSALSTSPPPTSLPQGVIWQLLYLIVLASCGGFLLQYTAQKYIPPATTAVILVLEAPFTVIISIFFGLEILTPQMILGFCVIFIAIIFSETKLSFLKKK